MGGCGQEGFKVMVASDLAARGVDVPEISHVVNFEMPLDWEMYCHRAGRAARNQREVPPPRSLPLPTPRQHASARRRDCRLRQACVAGMQGGSEPAQRHSTQSAVAGSPVLWI